MIESKLTPADLSKYLHRVVDDETTKIRDASLKVDTHTTPMVIAHMNKILWNGLKPSRMYFTRLSKHLDSIDFTDLAEEPILNSSDIMDLLDKIKVSISRLGSSESDTKDVAEWFVKNILPDLRKPLGRFFSRIHFKFTQQDSEQFLFLVKKIASEMLSSYVIPVIKEWQEIRQNPASPIADFIGKDSHFEDLSFNIFDLPILIRLSLLRLSANLRLENSTIKEKVFNFQFTLFFLNLIGLLFLQIIASSLQTKLAKNKKDPSIWIQAYCLGLMESTLASLTTLENFMSPDLQSFFRGLRVSSACLWFFP